MLVDTFPTISLVFRRMTAFYAAGRCESVWTPSRWIIQGGDKYVNNERAVYFIGSEVRQEDPLFWRHQAKGSRQKCGSFWQTRKELVNPKSLFDNWIKKKVAYRNNALPTCWRYPFAIYDLRPLTIVRFEIAPRCCYYIFYNSRNRFGQPSDSP